MHHYIYDITIINLNQKAKRRHHAVCTCVENASTSHFTWSRTHAQSFCLKILLSGSHFTSSHVSLAVSQRRITTHHDKTQRHPSPWRRLHVLQRILASLPCLMWMAPWHYRGNDGLYEGFGKENYRYVYDCLCCCVVTYSLYSTLSHMYILVL
jgi:hypothetical protein